MVKGFITVRDVDEKVLHRFKTRTVARGMKMGTALTQAMDIWVKSQEDRNKPNPAEILKLRGLIKTKKRVCWSEEVDQAVCGSKK